MTGPFRNGHIDRGVSYEWHQLNERGSTKTSDLPCFSSIPGVAAGVSTADDRGHRLAAGLPSRCPRGLARYGGQGNGSDSPHRAFFRHAASALRAVWCRRCCRFRGRWRTMLASYGTSSDNTTYAAHRATTAACAAGGIWSQSSAGMGGCKLMQLTYKPS